MKNKVLLFFDIRRQKQIKTNNPTERRQRTWADDSQNIMYKMQFTEKRKQKY